MAHAATGDMNFRLQTGNAFGAFQLLVGSGNLLLSYGDKRNPEDIGGAGVNYFWGDCSSTTGLPSKDGLGSM